MTEFKPPQVIVLDAIGDERDGELWQLNPVADNPLQVMELCDQDQCVLLAPHQLHVCVRYMDLVDTGEVAPDKGNVSIYVPAERFAEWSKARQRAALKAASPEPEPEPEPEPKSESKPKVKRESAPAKSKAKRKSVAKKAEKE